MFTGIVEGIGRVVALEEKRGGGRISIRPISGYRSFRRGESVSVSGVCLTAARSGPIFVADLSEETLHRSTLGELRAGADVNLEKALRWGDRLSGHFVLGHVDGVSRVLSIEPSGNSWIYRFTIPARLGSTVVEKGSVALDGVSLTVASRRTRAFDVAVIPETRRRTTLGKLRPGERVNFEPDLFVRYGRSRWRRRVQSSLPR